LTETQFIEKNSPQWKALEALLQKTDKDPDELHELFVKVSSDLSYARTYFPNRSVRIYLNNLTQEVFDSIRSKEKKAKFSGIFTFFTETLPVEVYKARTTFYIAVAIFAVAFLIGVVSTIHDESFTRTIIGDDYVEMTEANIAKGDPMAVYKDEDMLGMQLGITFNNIRVAFFAFILGLLGGVGTIYIMVYNGIMVGTFQYFFVTKGLFWTSFLTIWIHGTIEISAIILAGAAGLTLGSGILFPGTYPRSTSLQMAAKQAMIIILGTVPLFIIAGLLESYVTRETGLPDVIRAGIIIISFLFIIAMWVILPWRVSRSSRLLAMAQDIPPLHTPPLIYDKYSLRTFSKNVNIAFIQFRDYLSLQFRYIIIPSMSVVAVTLWFQLSGMDTSLYDLTNNPISITSRDSGGPLLYVVYWITFSMSFLLLSNYTKGGRLKLVDISKFTKLHFWKFAIVTFLWFTPVFLINQFWWSVLLLLILTPQVFINTYDRIAEEESLLDILGSSWKFAWQRIGNFFPMMIIAFAVVGLIFVLTSSEAMGLIIDFLAWHELFEFRALDNAFGEHLVTMTGILTIVPLIYFMFINQYHSEVCKTDASDLRKRFESFGENSSILEKH